MNIKEQTGFLGKNQLENTYLSDELDKLKTTYSKIPIEPKWFVGLHITENWLYTYRKEGVPRYALEIVEAYTATFVTISVVLSRMPQKESFIILAQEIGLFP